MIIHNTVLDGKKIYEPVRNLTPVQPDIYILFKGKSGGLDHLN